ncbi:MAG: D-glycero-beta-D-manno-heptose 1-phosphate adenylyltransferase [Deltaproteobacteria bacterium]|nr:MAG: D-glycero-beta-D-manno-heptose 1-phosphate adenylyltransferase [Deltaproteobacteria bacterium]
MSRAKIVSQSELLSRLEAPRRAGQTIVSTNGTFDLLHPGHVRYLEEAAALGDLLVVAMNSDRSVRRCKGPERPICNEAERAEMLAALAAVSFVTIFEEDTPLSLLAKLRPDIHVKGGSYDPARIAEEKALLSSWGGTFVTLDLVPGYSTTALIERIRGRPR